MSILVVAVMIFECKVPMELSAHLQTGLYEDLSVFAHSDS